MKITAVQAVPLGIPLAAMTPPSPWAPGVGRQILVRIATDDGLVGWGECFAYGATLAVCNVVDDALAPLLVGQDPTQIELHTDRMHRALMIWGRRGLAMMAVSGVELALWDLAGKARGVSLSTSCSAGSASRACAPTRACCVTTPRRTCARR